MRPAGWSHETGSAVCPALSALHIRQKSIYLVTLLFFQQHRASPEMKFASSIGPLVIKVACSTDTALLDAHHVHINVCAAPRFSHSLWLYDIGRLDTDALTVWNEHVWKGRFDIRGEKGRAVHRTVIVADGASTQKTLLD